MQYRAHSKATVRSNGPLSVLDAVLYVAPPPTDASQPSNTLACAIITPLLLQSWGRIFNSERNNLETRLCLYNNSGQNKVVKQWRLFTKERFLLLSTLWTI